MLTRLSLRLRVVLIFAGLAAAVIAATVVGLWLGYTRLGDPLAANGFVQAGVLAGFAALGLVAGVWYLFDLNVAKPIEVVFGGPWAGFLRWAGGGCDRRGPGRGTVTC